MGVDNPEIHNRFTEWVSLRVEAADVSTLPDGEIKNLNDRENIHGDIGIDNEKNIYMYSNNSGWITTK